MKSHSTTLFLWLAGIFLFTPAHAQTFTFVQIDTTIHYTDVDHTYYFRGQVHNLLQSERDLIFTLTQVSYPDTARQSAICTYVTCYPPRSGTFAIEETYLSEQIDDSVKFYIYNTRCDWTPGWCSPEVAPLDGDQICDVSVHSASDPNERITYRLRLLYGEGGVRMVSELVPQSAALLTSYPNPFNGQTRIRFAVSTSGPVSLNLFDIMGRHISTLAEQAAYSPGEYEYSWNATGANGQPLPTGTYLVQMTTANENSTKYLYLIR